MSERTQLEAKLLSAAELEVVNASRPPATQQASNEQLKVLAQRLRRDRDRDEMLPQRNTKCVEKLTQGEPSPTTRVGSRRSKCLEMPLSALRRN